MRTTPIYLAIALTAITAGACRKKQPPPDTTKPAASAVATPTATPVAAGPLIQERVHFALNRSELTAEAPRTLAADAKRLLENPTLRIRVEGHADERGSTEYNLALSDRRATAIRRYLMDLGVASDRIETLAFGEE